MKASSESGLCAMVISRVEVGSAADSAGVEVETLTAGVILSNGLRLPNWNGRTVRE